MAFLSKEELVGTYYPKAKNMDEDDVIMYIARANAYCKGYIGGTPKTVDEDLKTAVAMAFEIFCQGDTGKVDETTGNITDVAPTGQYVRKTDYRDPIKTVGAILEPYKRTFENENSIASDRGVMFI